MHATFPANLKWVTLPGEEGRLIFCTAGRSAVLRARRSFKGEPLTSEQVLGRERLASQQPIDASKGKNQAQPWCARLRTLGVAWSLHTQISAVLPELSQNPEYKAPNRWRLGVEPRTGSS